MLSSHQYFCQRRDVQTHPSPIISSTFSCCLLSDLQFYHQFAILKNLSTSSPPTLSLSLTGDTHLEFWNKQLEWPLAMTRESYQREKVKQVFRTTFLSFCWAKLPQPQVTFSYSSIKTALFWLKSCFAFRLNLLSTSIKRQKNCTKAYNAQTPIRKQKLHSAFKSSIGNTFFSWLQFSWKSKKSLQTP